MRAQLGRLVCWITLLASFTTAEKQHSQPSSSIQERQSCQGPSASNPQTWWRAQIGHNGTTPYAADSTFQYYRTVVQCGADNSGKEDASDAFNKAIDAWNRTGNTVTTMPAYVYVPPGNYLIKKPIQMLVSTFLIGDALNPPTLVADPALNGSAVINGYDDHQGDGSSSKNFYMAIRNLQIDTTRVPGNVIARAIDWSVSQACSLTNVRFTMPPSSSHIGITMDQGGSGTLISDCSFTGGAIGLQLANQQYSLKGLSFDGCGVGIFIQRSWVATVQGCSFANCVYGIDMGGANSSGAVSVVDSSVSNCTAGVNAYVSGNAEGSLVLDNFAVTDAVAVRSASGGTLFQGSVPEGQVWVMGNTNPGGYEPGNTFTIRRPADLLVNGKYFTTPLPQYEKYDISQFVSIKGDPDHPVYGDNSHDDGPAINAILAKHANCKIVFFPQGTYRTNKTILVPPGSRLVGEVFTTISGAGALFTDPTNPQPILKLGNPGDRGAAQLSDLLITVSDILPGAILLQINTASPQPGDIGLWNVALRVGGAVDSAVTTACGAPNPASCKAAFALFHLAPNASGTYLENVWGWVADHSLDRPATDPPQNIAVGRGALVENAAGPAWLVGTSFEHATLYQYALRGARGVYLGLHQSETPYWQGKSAVGEAVRAPAPWGVDKRWGDPDFENCKEGDDDRCYRAWGLYMAQSEDVVVHGSAMWAFFNGMNDNLWSDPLCDATGGICQTNMALVEGAKATWWFSASSKATANLVVDVAGNGSNGSAVLTTQADNPGGWGAVVAAYMKDTAGDDGQGEGEGEDIPSGAFREMTSGFGLVLAFVVMLYEAV